MKSPSKDKALKLIIESQTERLSAVREFVSSAAREYGFDDEAINKIALAVDEACTNIIKHAYKSAADKQIEISLQSDNGGFEIIISDQGTSFDPTAIDKPIMQDYLSHFRRGGLGIYLIRSLMDKVEYKAEPGKKNEVRLIKYLPVKNEQ